MKKTIVFLILCFPYFMQAQTPARTNYWDISLHIGPYISSISRNLNKEMQENLFRKAAFFGYGGGSDRMVNNNPVFSLGLERITPEAWSFKGMLSLLKGHVAGFSSKYGDLRVEYSQATVSLLAGYYSKQRTTRIAAGPSLSFINIQTAGLSAASFKANNTKPGFVAEAGIRFPAKGWLFFDVNSQYYYIGKQDLGTYDFGQYGSMQVGEKPASYLSFNFGLGVRLGI